MNVKLSRLVGKRRVAVIGGMLGLATAMLGVTAAHAQAGPGATDFGDAPDSYDTLLASGGAVHAVVTSTAERTPRR